MARLREFEPEVALERALQVFWKKGYEETSFDDIVDTTRVSRYGLYGAFGNKRDLFRKALRSYVEYLVTSHQGKLRQPDASIAEIRDYFNILLSDNLIVRRGCMMCNTAFEVAPRDRAIAADVRRYFDGLANVFRSALSNAKARSEIRPDADIDGAAVQLTGLILSSALMDRVGFDAAKVRQGVEAALSGLQKRLS